MACAMSGGTALPTCVYCGTSTLRLWLPVVSFERNSNQSGKDWSLASSRTVMILDSKGCT